MIRFTRKDHADDAIETLTLVRLDSSKSLAIQIEGGTPDDLGDFVGLYDLDGEQLTLGNETWEIEDSASFADAEADELAETLGLQRTGSPMPAATVRAGLMTSWESGSSICEEA